MRIKTLFIDKETHEPTLIDGIVSFEPKDDNRILHVLVILDTFNNVSNDLKMTCALHLDNCCDYLIDSYGKNEFLNVPNKKHTRQDTINEIKAIEEKDLRDQYIQEKKKEFVSLYNEQMFSIEDLEEFLDELSI
jgi:hypothetical protein